MQRRAVDHEVFPSVSFRVQPTSPERLPKALIHRNVPGQPVHALLGALGQAWSAAAPLSAFGRRQRWIAAVAALDATQWPVSGVVFAIDASRPHVRFAKGDYVTCCDKCAQKLRANPRHYLKA